MSKSIQSTAVAQFIIHQDGQPVVVDILNAQTALRRRGGTWVKYLVGRLPSGARFEARLNRPTAAEVRVWQRAHPAQLAVTGALHALADRLARVIGVDRVLTLFTKAISMAEAAL